VIATEIQHTAAAATRRGLAASVKAALAAGAIAARAAEKAGYRLPRQYGIESAATTLRDIAEALAEVWQRRRRRDAG
jgi:hypothetical protein